jgi:protein-S-isoprenylcysteine O-methyltransferase Ste14
VSESPHEPKSSEQREHERQDVERNVIIPYIVIGLLVWGSLLALGAYLFRGQYDVRKPLIIMACVGLFVGFWGLMLWANWTRLQRGSHRRNDSEP